MDDENRTMSVIAAQPPPLREVGAVAELARLKRELAISNRVAEIFLRVADDEELYREVLHVILEATGSESGVFGYIDEQGDLHCTSLARTVGQQRKMADQSIKYPRASWTEALWCRALRDNRILCWNTPRRGPDEHVAYTRSVDVPLFCQGSAIGLLQVANKATNYDGEDVRLLEDIARHVVPILCARLDRDREERTRQRTDQALRKMEWLLTRHVGMAGRPGEKYIPPYGDLANLNTCREVLDSAGDELLRTIVTDLLDLLDTSANVFEKNGDYALGTVSSGWCRLLDQASRALCTTEDNEGALACGKWLCHESRCTEASRASIETGQPVDIECRGGLRLFAVPIPTQDEVVGSITFAYGDPPRDRAKLEQISVKYGLRVDALLQEASSFDSRPQCVVEMAKKVAIQKAILIGTSVDRRRAEVSMKRSEARFRAVFEQAAVGIAHVSPNGRWLQVNQKLSDIVGYSAEELTRLTVQDITHPDDLDADRAYVRRMLAGVIDTYAMEKRFVRKSGDTVWTNWTVAVMRNESGAPDYFISVVEDISARKTAERKSRQAQLDLLIQQRHETSHVQAKLDKVREELLRTTRLATIGQVMASIAHDLRNPLGAVRNAAFYLKRRVPKDAPELCEFLQIIEDAVDDANRIISSLLALTRSRPAIKQTIDLRRLAEDVFGRITNAHGVDCRIATVPDPLRIQADPDQFRQVLINLGQNAVDAMEGNGQFLIQASRAADCDEIIVRDTGPGIPDDIQKQIFEPLVTTKAKGTGLGLTLCRLIIERHGGTIEVVENETLGAAFRITLPWKRRPFETR